MTFKDLRLSEPILRALNKEGYTTPTPIQNSAIPIALSGKDILGCAQTGTGKTAAFALPIIHMLSQTRDLSKSARSIRALILTPTRELAVQIGDSFRAYGVNTDLRHAVIFGGVPQKRQTEVLKYGVDTLVATPGRLLDLMNQGFVSLKNIGIFVLDEADRMLDMGFINDIKKIIKQLPTKRQTLFFSATMPPEIAKLADTILVQPEKISITPASTTVESIDQKLYYVKRSDKKSLLLHLLKNESIESALVFTRTKHGANRVTDDIIKAGFSAEAIHGNKSQSARQRALSNFKQKKIQILVATDIAARGIDVDELTHVINFEMPHMPETYVHRIGRTGRAGLSGTAMSFCDEEETLFVRDINKLIKIPIPVIESHPFQMVLKVNPDNIRKTASRNVASYGDTTGHANKRFGRSPRVKSTSYR